MRINFDMDGTIANFYGVDGWLESLQAGDTKPYREAKPLINFSLFARLLNKIQKNGIEIAIVSWTAKCGNAEFNTRIAETKLEWLKKYLPSVKWDAINIVNYGTVKNNFCYSENDILFDDEEQNRNAWNGISYNVNNILETLRGLA